MQRFSAAIGLAFILGATVLQSGCGYLAAGAAGAAIGHEVAERDEEQEENE